MVYNWLFSSIIVGLATFGAGVSALVGGTRLQQAGLPFLALGAVTRVGLFFGLIAMLVFGLSEYFELYSISHGKQLLIEVLIVVGLSVLLYPFARRAQLKRLSSHPESTVETEVVSFNSEVELDAELPDQEYGLGQYRGPSTPALEASSSSQT